MTIPTCPEHPGVPLSPRKRGWRCVECDVVVPTFDEHPRSEASGPEAGGPAAAQAPAAGTAEGPGELLALADALPTLLALPLSELLHERSPALALWAACDLVETALKFVVMAGVAEHVAASGRLPDGLARELRDRVELPTMGKWLGMAQAVARHPPRGSTRPLARMTAGGGA
jgi:hypothetical protein